MFLFCYRKIAEKGTIGQITMATSLLDLPDELIVKILDHLDVHDLVR